MYLFLAFEGVDKESGGIELRRALGRERERLLGQFWTLGQTVSQPLPHYRGMGEGSNWSEGQFDKIYGVVEHYALWL
jgi:hypothetical protein